PSADTAHGNLASAPERLQQKEKRISNLSTRTNSHAYAYKTPQPLQTDLKRDPNPRPCRPWLLEQGYRCPARDLSIHRQAAPVEHLRQGWSAHPRCRRSQVA